MRLDVGGERVLKRADGLATGIVVLEERVICEKERVCLSYGNVDREPVARRRGVGGIQAVFVQPSRHSRYAVRCGRHQGRDLEEHLGSR